MVSHISIKRAPCANSTDCGSGASGKTIDQFSASAGLWRYVLATDKNYLLAGSVIRRCFGL
jgi:hypothetical protein